MDQDQDQVEQSTTTNIYNYIQYFTGEAQGAGGFGKVATKLKYCAELRSVSNSMCKDQIIKSPNGNIMVF